MMFDRYLTRRIICIFLAGLALIIFIVWGRAYYGSFMNYKKGVEYLQKNESIKAITYFDRALHWYTPLDPYIEKSANGLWKISEVALAQEDLKMALIAVKTIRRGFYSARSFYTPGQRWIKRCDEKIARIHVYGGREKNRDNKIDPDENFIHEGQMFEAPNVLWTIILEIGLVGWISMIIALIFRINPKKGNGQPAKSYLIKYIGLASIFFFLWVLGMNMA